MCDAFEDGKKYLRKDTTIICWEKSQIAIGLFFIIIWVICFPVAVFQRIKKE
jgi:hypothetical protein